MKDRRLVDSSGDSVFSCKAGVLAPGDSVFTLGAPGFVQAVGQRGDCLLRCLSKDPSDRPVDMHTFIRELQEISLEPQQRWTDERCRSWWTQIPVFDANVDQTPGQKHLVPDERGTALTQELYRDTISQAETAESPLAEPRADETTHLDVRESS